MRLFNFILFLFALVPCAYWANADNLQLLDYHQLNADADSGMLAIWGYEDNNNEYAVIGSMKGYLFICNVTDPTNIIVVDSIPHIVDGFEDLEIYKHTDGTIYAYSASGWGGGPGEIFNLTTRTVAGSLDAQTIPGHGITIDTANALLYYAAAGNGVRVYDIGNTPADPEFLCAYSPPDSLSLFPPNVRDIAAWGGSYFYASDIYATARENGDPRIYIAAGDFGLIIADLVATGNREYVFDNDSIYQIQYRSTRDTICNDSMWIFTHSVMVSGDGRYVFTGDEPSRVSHGSPMGVMQVFDLPNDSIDNLVSIASGAGPNVKSPIFVYEVLKNSNAGSLYYDIDDVPIDTTESDSNTSIHYIHYLDSILYISYYSKGVRLLDFSMSSNVKEMGYWSPNSELDYSGHGSLYPNWGCWGVYPFASGTIIATCFDGLRTFRYARAGTLNTSETWSKDTYIYGDIVIPSGISLTVNPGVNVYIMANTDSMSSGANSSKSEILVYGKLDINGTSGNEVSISSCTASPAAQDWYGIRNYGKVEMEYCSIKYAYTPVRNWLGSCKTELNHCILDSFYNYGVYATTGSLSVKNTTISNPSYNSARGMSLGTSNLTFLEIENNTISGFAGTSNLYGILLSTSTLNMSISGNTFNGFSNGSNRFAIYLFYSDNITVSGNTISGVADFTKGIYLSGCDDCTLDGNIISYCTSKGIECYNSGSVMIDNNLLKDMGSSAEAICVNGSSTSGDITNNHICAENENYSCNTGIRSISNAISNVLNNTVEDFTDLGIRTGTSGDSLFCGSSAEHGNNSIYWNFDDKGSSTGYLFILSESGSTTPALYNYFGSSPSAGNFYYLVDWSNYLSYPESDLMVMYYRNNTGSGSTTYDECLLGNDGTINGASWTWEIGDFSYILDYDGSNDYVDISHAVVSNIFNNDDDFTIVAWVNPDSFPVNGTTIDGAAIVGQQYCTSMVFGIRSDGKLFLSMDDTNLGSPKSNTALYKDQWQQVAVTYDNSVDSCRFYINGEYDGKGLITDNTIGVQDVLFIGWQSRTDPSYHPGYFNGGIDEVQIYNHVLTEFEINGLYNDFGAVVTKPTTPQVVSSVPSTNKSDGNLVNVFPNPMSSSAGFTFKVAGELSKAVNVKLCIFDYAGKLVYTLINSSFVAGCNHQIIWDGKLENGQNAPEGIYYYEYTTPDKSETGKLMLVK